MKTHKKVRILIAEDDLISLQLYEIYFRNFESVSIDATYVSDGAEAVRLAITSEFDIILMDIMLQKVDGITAIKQIRKAGIKTPVIAATAGNYMETACMKAGFDEFLLKPFFGKVIEEIISKYIVL